MQETYFLMVCFGKFRFELSVRSSIIRCKKMELSMDLNSYGAVIELWPKSGPFI